MLLFMVGLLWLQLFAQGKYEIFRVKGAEVNKGVVILSVQVENKRFELQCNEGALGCVSLRP